MKENKWSLFFAFLHVYWTLKDMNNIFSFIEKINWGIIIVLCATLGLAPFSPPHVIEKLSMLFEGRLIKPIDWLDLFLHGFPWILLLLKVLTFMLKKE